MMGVDVGINRKKDNDLKTVVVTAAARTAIGRLAVLSKVQEPWS